MNRLFTNVSAQELPSILQRGIAKPPSNMIHRHNLENYKLGQDPYGVQFNSRGISDQRHIGSNNEATAFGAPWRYGAEARLELDPSLDVDKLRQSFIPPDAIKSIHVPDFVNLPETYQGVIGGLANQRSLPVSFGGLASLRGDQRLDPFKSKGSSFDVTTNNKAFSFNKSFTDLDDAFEYQAEYQRGGLGNNYKDALSQVTGNLNPEIYTSGLSSTEKAYAEMLFKNLPITNSIRASRDGVQNAMGGNYPKELIPARGAYAQKNKFPFAYLGSKEDMSWDLKNRRTAVDMGF